MPQTMTEAADRELRAATDRGQRSRDLQMVDVGVRGRSGHVRTRKRTQRAQVATLEVLVVVGGQLEIELRSTGNVDLGPQSQPVNEHRHVDQAGRPKRLQPAVT